MKTHTRYVITHHEHGIYLGSCLGFGFWSNLDPVGQPCAVVFPHEIAARGHIFSWKDPRLTVDQLIILPVQTRGDSWATIAECVAAGLPGWNPNPPEKE